MSTSLTWLHLSDLHYCEPITGDDSRLVLESLIKDLKKMEAEHGLQPDVIFFTGDLAFGHIKDEKGFNLKDQFEGASRFLDKVRTAFTQEIPRENVFIIPGNHDVNRSSISPDQEEWLDHQNDIKIINALLQNTPVQWKRYVERLDEYAEFLHEKGYSHLLTDRKRLIYAHQREINGIKVGLMGLNSAWSCGRQLEKSKLWMGGAWQLDHLLPVMSDCDVKIGLIHHPSGWLVMQEDPNVRRQIQRDVDFCLHGHEHQDWVEQSNQHVTVAAGACYDSSTTENGYNFVRLDLASGTGEVWLRRYHNRGGGWVPEAVPERTGNEGCWPLQGLRKMQLPEPIVPEPVNDAPVTLQADTRPDAKAGGQFTPSRVFRQYVSDIPPLVDVWVGREDELRALEALQSGVAVIGGIGGQGKSTLIAKFLELWKAENPNGFWDWRDCREEGERFHTQLVSLIAHFTQGAVTGDQLVNADTREVVRYFFELVGDKHGIIVLDNVDYYVDVENSEFSLGVAVFVQEALRIAHNLKIVITCRPHVNYGSPRFLDIPLAGLDEDEALNLFKQKGIDVAESKSASLVKEIWQRTEGHPLWMTLIAVQMNRSPRTAPKIVDELRKGGLDKSTKAMFKALWQGLDSQQQEVLRILSELSYPETQETLWKLSQQLIRSDKQFRKAFNGLKALNLVVERESYPTSTFDLHPLVGSFIRTEYPAASQRLKYIQPILVFFRSSLKSKAGANANITTEDMRQWISRIELENALGDIKSASQSLVIVSDHLIAQCMHEEFFRLTKLLFDHSDWSSDKIRDLPDFHNVIENFITSLMSVSRKDDSFRYMERYQNSAGSNTVAKMRCLKVSSYINWLAGKYDVSINQAREGIFLKKSSSIDTDVDFNNALALSLRDSGDSDEALEILLEGHKIGEFLNDDHKSKGKHSSFYGNVGRCLYFKGNKLAALRFYVKSAEIMRSKSTSYYLINSGYAMLWIAEVLEDLKDLDGAYIFYRRCVNYWVDRAPIRVKGPLARVAALTSEVDSSLVSLDDRGVEHRCDQWMRSYWSQAKYRVL